MSLIKLTLGGLVGACIGAVIWLLVAPFIPVIPGILMLVIGWMAGKGVQKGWGDRELTIFHGMIAATCAIAAIVGTQYLSISNEITDAKNQIENYEPSREDIVGLIAFDMVAEIQKKGQTVEMNPVASLTPQPEQEEGQPQDNLTIESSWDTETELTAESSAESLPDTVADDEKIDAAIEAAEATEEASTPKSSTPKKEQFPEAIWKVADQLYDHIDEEQHKAYSAQAMVNKTNDMGYGPELMTEPVEELTKVKLRKSFDKLDFIFMGLTVLLALKVGSTDPYEYFDDEE